MNNSKVYFVQVDKKIDEQNLKEMFQEKIKKSFTEKMTNTENQLSVAVANTSENQQSGKWINPDLLLKLGDDIYYSYEFKRWKDMSPIAPHEARSHARHISNYPYVVIEVPEDLFEFVIENNINFQIIREDCKERGIGLILYDKNKENILHLLSAEYFTPDPINKINFLNQTIKWR
jgi:hypothetical protein